MEDKKGCLILTVGLPRAGKSTWAKEQGYPMVNPDSIRLALYGTPFIQEAEDFVWAIAYTMAKSLFLAGHHTVIVDATNITEKLRNAWKYKFKEYEITHWYFDTTKEVCIERAESDGKAYLIPVIERMSEAIDYE